MAEEIKTEAKNRTDEQNKFESNLKNLKVEFSDELKLLREEEKKIFSDIDSKFESFNNEVKEFDNKMDSVNHSCKEAMNTIKEDMTQSIKQLGKLFMFCLYCNNFYPSCIWKYQQTTIKTLQHQIIFSDDKQTSEFQNAREALANTIRKVSDDIEHIEQVISDQENTLRGQLVSTNDLVKTTEQNLEQQICKLHEKTESCSETLSEKVEMLKDKLGTQQSTSIVYLLSILYIYIILSLFIQSTILT